MDSFNNNNQPDNFQQQTIYNQGQTFNQTQGFQQNQNMYNQQQVNSNIQYDINKTPKASKGAIFAIIGITSLLYICGIIYSALIVVFM